VQLANLDESFEGRRKHEKHPDEQQAGAQEDGGKELVLEVADPVADRAHEPEEEDPAERHQSQRDLDLAAAGGIGEPGGVVRVCGYDRVNQDKDDAQGAGRTGLRPGLRHGASGAPWGVMGAVPSVKSSG
jgi:hypothetical protein